MSQPGPTTGPVEGPSGSTPPPIDRGWVVAGGVVGGLVLVLLAGLIALVWLSRTGGLPTAAASPSPGTPGGPAIGVYAYPGPGPAPALALLDQDGQPFDLDSLRGQPALVFFGYTHCPDVCPATIGVLNRVLGEVEPGPRVVFVSIDPERDTPAALKEFLEFLPDAYTGLTGTAAQVRVAADAYGVTYGRVDTGSASGYAMSHTANVYLLDAAGRLTLRFPFGTEAPVIAEAIRKLGGTAAGSSPRTSPAPSSAPSPSSPSASTSPTPGTGQDTLGVLVRSTSIWSGGASPVLMTLTDSTGAAVGAATTEATAQLVNELGVPEGTPAPATIVRPPGEQRDVLLARLDIPTAGHWRVSVGVTDAGRALQGWTDINVLDPGETAALGEAAPDVRTPTAADVGGVLAAVTTDPQPDPRLSQTSTADARAAGQPYVLVIDSYRFRVSPACGRAIGMARFLADRWPTVAFIHLEPYHYSLISGSPSLDGDISDPSITSITRSWGIGYGQWGPASVPWVFVVDGDGTVQAKYSGVMGSDDIDVILSDIVR
jgi:protein SCO1/2